MPELLDTTYKYMVWGRDECFWLFVYESSYIGTVKAWQSYKKQPGSFYVPQGPKTEQEVIDFLLSNNHKLDEEDKLDLYLFVNKGGLEEFLEENRIKIDYGTNTGRID